MVRYAAYINGQFLCHVYSSGPIQSCLDVKNTIEYRAAIQKKENEVFYLTTVPDLVDKVSVQWTSERTSKKH